MSLLNDVNTVQIQIVTLLNIGHVGNSPNSPRLYLVTSRMFCVRPCWDMSQFLLIPPPISEFFTFIWNMKVTIARFDCHPTWTEDLGKIIFLGQKV